ncbi:Rossmann-like and DUF2520 domain-containing protein [Leadbetterella sp. DM7]|uniref:Rossmann-like and DUF2520 domain-containing protein n=1 Tax=Leadbetterella sp. DM7 TaxID=3235085 RepID=UPI00349ECB5E
MKITIVGAGNLAGHLARALERVEVAVNEIYARDIRKAAALADGLYAAVPVNSLDFSRSSSEVFFLCVSDDALESVASQILLPDGAILAHTSGARPLSVLDGALSLYHGRRVDCGVFYPLQTFTQGVPLDFNRIPILVESEDKNALAALTGLARRLSGKVLQVSSKERLVYHVSAVFSCNFTNHLWALSKEILESENLDFELLKPLIAETVKKMMQAGHPADVQTGPAIRKDRRTLEAHLAFLADDEDLSKVYSTLTESISDWHRPE